MIQRYRKLPVEIEAVQWDGRNWIEIQTWTNHKIVHFNNNYLEISTLEGVMRANINDYIIKGVKGEFYPCKPDIFESTYEKVTK